MVSVVRAAARNFCKMRAGRIMNFDMPRRNITSKKHFCLTLHFS